MKINHVSKVGIRKTGKDMLVGETFESGGLIYMRMPAVETLLGTRDCIALNNGNLGYSYCSDYQMVECELTVKDILDAG